MNKKYAPLLLVLIMLATSGFILYFMGRTPVCTCGYIKLWEGDTFSEGNSQHVSDWYTFSHIIHGFIFFYLIRKIFPKLSFTQQLFIALCIESGWEILENSPLIINRYRTTTGSVLYYGDSILNSLSDITAMTIGFYAARYVSWKVIVVAAIIMELTTIYMIHDALIFNIIMLIYPIQSIKDWQMQLSH